MDDGCNSFSFAEVKVTNKIISVIVRCRKCRRSDVGETFVNLKIN
jgi:hypothetical protein